MKKIILILLLLSFFDGEAQRKRKTLFDADVVTPVDSGFYGIGIIDNQAYLINHRKDSIKFKMEYPYVRAWHTGKDLSLTLNRNHPTMIVAVRDSVTFTLPSASDTLNKYVKYDINYIGVRGGIGTNKWVPFDETYRIVFSDSVSYYNSANKTTYRTKVFDHLNPYSWFRITPWCRFGLEIINNKWYLNFRPVTY